MPSAYKLSFYSWITQGIPTAQIQAAVQSFATALEKELAESDPGVTVNVQAYPDVPPQIDAVVKEERHIALINPLGLVFANRTSKDVQAAAVALRKDAVTGAIGPFYRAQIYTANAKVQTLNDLQGRSMGFGSPISTSNFLFPANLLKTDHLLWFAASLNFLGGHPQVAKAVYAGTIDVGAGHDGVIVDLATQPGYSDAAQKLRRLCWIGKASQRSGSGSYFRRSGTEARNASDHRCWPECNRDSRCDKRLLGRQHRPCRDEHCGIREYRKRAR